MQPDSQHFLLAVMGPTASGKTALAIDIARHFRTEIISVDSRQFFRELNTGTAKPTPDELARARHHFIDKLSITEEYTAGRFAADALQVLEDVFKKHPLAVAVGGSTLYFRALLEGIDQLPEVSGETRHYIQTQFELQGLTWLQEQVRQRDPAYYAQADQNNPRRLMRALEVCLASEKTYSSFLSGVPEQRSFSTIKIGLEIDRNVLYERINSRCESMLAEGLLDEVRAVYPYRDHTALQTVGYTEFFNYLDGLCSYEKAVELFKQHTRNYAKRQMTWLRREKDIYWFDPKDKEKIITFIEDKIKESGHEIT